jgi:alcohol dehydrogenase YqhD (iron-dependent ADH family)
MFETKKGKLAQYGKRIFNLEGTEDEIANEAINKTVEFFHKMGMDTKLSDYTEEYDDTADFIVNRFEERGWLGLGEKQNITLDKVKAIVEMSY